MEKQSLTQGQGHKEMLRRVAAHRHGEDFNADIDNEYSYKMGVWCAKTAWAYWRQAPMVEFVNKHHHIAVMEWLMTKKQPGYNISSTSGLKSAESRVTSTTATHERLADKRGDHNWTARLARRVLDS